MNDLFQTENLRMLVPVLVGFIAACVGLVSAISVAICGYIFGKRTEINKLRLKKGYALAEKIAQDTERIERSYHYFEIFWHGNYRHVSFEEGISNFDAKHVLFEDVYDSIQELANIRQELGKTLLGAWLYLPLGAVEAVQAYLEIGAFKWKEVHGFTDNYHEVFFNNLLDPNNKAKRLRAYGRVKRKFSRLKL